MEIQETRRYPREPKVGTVVVSGKLLVCDLESSGQEGYEHFCASARATEVGVTRDALGFAKLFGILVYSYYLYEGVIRDVQRNEVLGRLFYYCVLWCDKLL